MIIDSLHHYPKPVFVYLPPNSQLRGGAWVVVDPAINPDQMEMYADPVSCRAGVLEPEGTVEIKFRKPDLIKTILRLDQQCRQWKQELDQIKKSGTLKLESGVPSQTGTSVEQRCIHLQKCLEDRQNELLPFYQQVSYFDKFILIQDIISCPGFFILLITN